MENSINLRNRFLSLTKNNWKWINCDNFEKSIPKTSGVYYLVASDDMVYEIQYVGSSINLNKRLNLNHSAIKKILKRHLFCIIFYKEIPKSFYDYEIKLIKKLKPKFNISHKK